VPDGVVSDYAMSLGPNDFGPAEDSLLYSPCSSIAIPARQEPVERTNARSLVSTATNSFHITLADISFQRRRAQNRAAQRAFRERKEKHARELEQKLSELTKRYQSLVTSHAELTTAYEKLQKTVETLSQKEEVKSSNRSGETPCKFLTILHSQIRFKAERK
jgi:hypothetical protein